MGFNCGIVGLPNVGKSTLFNALTSTQAAEAANYPFCTIEPNVGRVAVPDARLDILGRLAKSAKIIGTQLEFVDIAGLVRGASKGEGLGNQFLSHIRAVDAIAHVLRCFEDSNVTHVEGSIGPVRDAETVETELMLADLDALERRLVAAQKRARGNDKEARAQIAMIEPLLALLRDGKPARVFVPAEDDTALFKSLQLLSAKPVLYVANVEEGAAASGNAASRAIAAYAAERGAASVVISAAIEAEVAQLADDAEKKDFLGSLWSLAESGLDRVIHAGYALLDLVTFFTVGPKEAHAWTVPKGAKAPQAAGVIHTDFEHGFIRAETIAYDDFVTNGGEQGAKDAGRNAARRAPSMLSRTAISSTSASTYKAISAGGAVAYDPVKQLRRSQTMGQTITLKASDGHSLGAPIVPIPGRPSRRGAIVVIQEIFGVNHHIRDADRPLRGAGLCRDRTPGVRSGREANFEAGYLTSRAWTRAAPLRGKISTEALLMDTQCSPDRRGEVGRQGRHRRLLPAGRPGRVPGGDAAQLACRRRWAITAARSPRSPRRSRASIDHAAFPAIRIRAFPLTDVEKIKKAQPGMPIFVYKAGHGFHCDERASFSPFAAQVAGARTQEFFLKNVG